MDEDETPVARLLDEMISHRRMLSTKYHERARLADEIANIMSADKGLVGRVAITEDIGGEEIPVDIPPETWVLMAHENPAMLGEGYYYIIVDPKSMSLVLASVTSAIKPSSAKSLAPQQPLVTVPLEAPHPLSIAGNVVSMRLWLRPLLAIHLGDDGAKRIVDAFRKGREVKAVAELLGQYEASSPTIPPDPSSPVAIPAPSVLEALLAPAKEGVVIGGLAVMDNLYLAHDRPVAIKLPWSVMVKHVLVTGTTGSGKTSMVKNMIVSALGTKEAHIVILDANSDYVAGLFPGYIPGDKMTKDNAAVLKLYGADPEPGKPLLHQGLKGLIVIPCSGCTEDKNYLVAARDYTAYLRQILSRSYGRQGCQLELGGIEPLSTGLYRVSAKTVCGNAAEETTVYIAPRRITLRDIGELAELDPFMTPRARELLQILVYRCKPQNLEELLSIIRGLRDRECAKGVKPHYETLRNLENRVRIMRDLDIIDVSGDAPSLGYDSLAEAMRNTGLRVLVADLGYAATRARHGMGQEVKVLLGYKLLQSLATYMEKASVPRYAMLVVDEAHLFFPGRGGGYSDLLRSVIERLARLGRSRGISIVFSTHREQDVSPIVAMLANTKIYLRTDRRSAEELPIPAEYKRRLPYYRDHAAVVASYAVRGGYIGVRNAPPLIGHRTV